MQIRYEITGKSSAEAITILHTKPDFVKANLSGWFATRCGGGFRGEIDGELMPAIFLRIWHLCKAWKKEVCEFRRLGQQGEAAEQILEAGVGAEAIEYGIDGEVGQPDGMILVGGLKPVERLLFVVQGGVDLRQAVG